MSRSSSRSALSVAVVMLESVKSIAAVHGPLLHTLEWVFTILFAIEYIVRLLCVRRPAHYAWSFFGVVDLLAVLPGFISLFTSANYIMVVRVLRLLRVFRILKLAHFLEESETLTRALRASQRKILGLPLRRRHAGHDHGDGDVFDRRRSQRFR